MTHPAALERLAASFGRDWLAAQRWFGGKGRGIERVEPVAGIEAEPGAALLLVDVYFDGGDLERYAVPSGRGLWCPLVRHLARGPREGFRLDWRGGTLPSGDERELGRDQSNTTYVLDGRIALKCYRRLWAGPHPEVETVTFLTGRTSLVPAVRGVLSYREADGAVWPIALLQDFVPAAEDGWAWGQTLLGEALAAGSPTRRATGWARPLGRDLATLQRELCGLGSRVAEKADAGEVLGAAGAQLDDALALVDSDTAHALRRLEPGIREELDRLRGLEGGPLCRVHGDLHIGQVLRSAAGFHVVDFEGEPTRPPSERRALVSPMRDVASMARSFEHLARWHLRDDPDPGRLSSAIGWVDAVRSGFLDGYADGARGSETCLDPVLLRAFEVEKETYEFVYAARFLPEWTPIALAAMEALVASSGPA